MTMPAPVADERAALREFLTTQQRAFDVAAVNLSDQQASCTPSASALSLAGLIKHLTHVQGMWNARVSAAVEGAVGEGVV